MPELDLTKTSSGNVRGVTQADEERREKWHRFMQSLEPGEIVTVKYWQMPDPQLHRTLLALFRLGFEHFRPELGRKRMTYKGRPIEKSFDRFRKDITIRAGYYEPHFDAHGRVKLEADSIAYGKMDDEKKRQLLDAVVNVLLEDILGDTYTRESLNEVIPQLLEFGS